MRHLPVLSILSLRKTSAIVTPEQFHRRSVNWLLHSFSPSSTPSRAVKPSNGFSLHFFSCWSLSHEQNPKAASLRGCLQREEENKWARVPCVDCNCSYGDHPSTNKTPNNLARAWWNNAVRFNSTTSSRRFNYHPSSSRFMVKFSHFGTNIKQYSHSPGLFAPLYRSKNDDRDKGEKPDARSHRGVFFVCFPFVVRGLKVSRWKAPRWTDSCDCLMACICQSKKSLEVFTWISSSRGLLSSPAALLTRFQVALI